MRRLLNYYDSLRPRQQAFALLLLTFCIELLSTPRNYVLGTLFAEEGSTYLRYARYVGGWPGLLAPHQGYFSLVPNLVMFVAARYLPLALAPLLAVWSACLVHLLVCLCVLTSEAFYTWRMRLCATLAVVLTVGSPVSPGTIHSQFYLAIAAAIVLVSDPKKHSVLRNGVLLLGGLTGTVTAMFAPFFLWRAVQQKSRAAWQQCGLVFCCALVQGLVVLSAMPHTTRSALKHNALWVYVDSLFNHLVVLPFGTRLLYHLLGVALGKDHPALGVFIVGIAGIAAFALGTVLWKGGWRARVLAAAGLFVSLCSVAGMEGGLGIIGGGERYFLVGNACISLALLLTFARLPSADGPLPRVRQIAAVLLLVSCFSGFTDIGRYWKAEQYPLHWQQQLREELQPAGYLLHNGPASWEKYQYTVPLHPAHDNIPYYVFDSNVR